MINLTINIDRVLDFVSRDKIHAFQPSINESFKTLYEKSGKGNDYLGWIDLPTNIDPEIIDRIEKGLLKKVPRRYKRRLRFLS